MLIRLSLQLDLSDFNLFVLDVVSFAEDMMYDARYGLWYLSLEICMQLES